MDRSTRRARNLDALIARAESDRSGLRRDMGPVQLAALGVATIVGSGLFVLTGQAAAQYAGPAVAISFAIAGFAATLAALCYMELATAVPVAGSTYTFTYVALGPLLAWLVAWNIVLEYLFGGAAVAVGWSGYFENALEKIGIDLPTALTAGPLDDGVLNVPSVLLVALVTLLLVVGTRESARATTLLVALKLGVLVLFVAFGVFYVTSANYEPFIPQNAGEFGEFGWSGVLRAAGTVFYAYIGFDIICTAAQEARDPRRTVPRGVLGALAVAVVIYIAVAFVVVGLVSYTQLDVADPLSVAVGAVSELEWLQALVDVSAVAFLAATVLATLYGMTRVVMRTGEDGMVPRRLARVDARRGTPVFTTIIVGGVAAVLAGLLPISILADLVSVGTLSAFVVVAIAVLVLRRTRPDLERPIRLPFGPVIPLATIVVTVGVAAMLPAVTLLRLAIWVAIGLAVFMLYSRARSRAVIDARIGETA